jgi:diguanylate cyclase (GGDEF)-like protein
MALSELSADEMLAVLYIDIDEFKGINDSLGHTVGDELLNKLSRRLKGCLSENELLARIGGDEFAIIQTPIRDHSETATLIGKLYVAIRQPLECQGHTLSADASVGVAVAPEHGTDIDLLLMRADMAMYEAKANGRRGARWFEASMEAKFMAIRAMERDLAVAIVNGEFEVHFQPLVRLADDMVVGFEALVRWRHPNRGLVSPEEFIPVAEETGLIEKLGEWVLLKSCTEATAWPPHVKVAVMSRQFSSKTPPLRSRLLMRWRNLDFVRRDWSLRLLKQSSSMMRWSYWRRFIKFAQSAYESPWTTSVRGTRR